MLAHKPRTRVMVAELIAAEAALDYDCIPWIIYTSPSGWVA